MALGAPLPGSTRVAPAQTSGENEQVFELRIEKEKIQPPLRALRVRRGDRVRLRFTADDEVEVHLHGYDILVRATPDQPAEMTFEARATGRFAISLHAARGDARGPVQRSGHGHKILLYLEVHPR